MGKIGAILGFTVISLFTSISAFPQVTNIGFENGNFTNWKGYTWLYSTEASSVNTSKKEGIVSRRQTIMSDTSEYDANTGYALRKIPKGYLFSARLGDEITDDDSNPRCWEQSLRYTMKVDSSNCLLIIKFACVLQYASDHTALMEPRFRFTLFDANNDTIPDCSNYDVYASSDNVEGFQTYTPSSSSSSTPGDNSSSPVKWRDWTTVGANLSAYMGQTITLEFMTADCTGKFHYGYAYFVADCRPEIITSKYCKGDTVAKLTAADGAESYLWTNSKGSEIDTAQTLIVTNPVEGATYSCLMTSATGCKITLKSTIAKYLPVSAFSSYMIDCKSNTVQLVNSSSTNNGSMLYQWDFGDSVTSTAQNPKYTFATSGMHWVTLVTTNPPSVCADTLAQYVESFSPPLVGISGDSTYCPDLTTWLKAYGAYRYEWNTGSTANSLEIGDPGGTYWMIGYSSTGCHSDTIYKDVSEEPDWTFTSESDTTFCTGDSATLKVSGAACYIWSTGDTTCQITVKKAAAYSVTGLNTRGCKHYYNYQVTEFPLPDVAFSLSPYTINSKHNTISCSIPYQSGVSNYWDLGDGSTGTSTSFTHAYNVSNDILEYTITLTATTENGCSDSLSQVIDVVPFIPNVFTPNTDGVNDVFMPNIDLEIFDRNGIRLYKGSEGWDGKYNGKAMVADTYFYQVSYQDRNNKTQYKKGYVTLVR
jgi:gliding motility-associated-like protein